MDVCLYLQVDQQDSIGLTWLTGKLQCLLQIGTARFCNEYVHVYFDNVFYILMMIIMIVLVFVIMVVLVVMVPMTTTTMKVTITMAITMTQYCLLWKKTRKRNMELIAILYKNDASTSVSCLILTLSIKIHYEISNTKMLN